MPDSSENSLLKFPCDFVIKIMGNVHSDFKTVALDIVKKHYSDDQIKEISQRVSQNGNYLALSIKIHAESKKQLDALYTELSQSKEILMVL